VATVASVLSPVAVRAGSGSTARGRFIALLKEQADLTSAGRLPGWNQRGAAVNQALRDVATSSQAGVRAVLEQAKAAGQVSVIMPYWVMNAIAFEGEQAVADQIAERPEVAGVQADQQVLIEPDLGGVTEPPVGTVEWNVDKIRAPEVWTQGLSGAGTVVASIDSGVDFTHPALAAQYRGLCPFPPFDHSCSFFDAVDGQAQPYDDHGHGTHVTGTMVGGDGPGAFTNDIGVAFGAKWIAAKAFNYQGIGLLTWIIAASQWVMEPGGSAALRPQVINNSWSFAKCAVFFGFDSANPLILNSWRASGMLPVFAIGNTLVAAPGTAKSPGDLKLAFGSGATDRNDILAHYSGRGPSCDALLTTVKPDVAAPGTSIRSAVPQGLGGGYKVMSGTSMAAPHVSGAAAVVIQAAGGVGSISVADLETTIRNTAIDLGPAGADNQYGHGRIDLFQAVALAAKKGVLKGTITKTGCRTTAGALVEVKDTANPADVRVVRSVDANNDGVGEYEVPHLAGTYDVRIIELFGYNVPTAVNLGVVVPDNTTVVLTLVPSAKACGSIAGTVTRFESGEPIGGLKVRVNNTPIALVTTNSLGAYFIPDVPFDDYTVTVLGDRCSDPATMTKPVTVNGAEILDFAIKAKKDSFGYFCQESTSGFIPALDPVDLAGDDRTATLALPFGFKFYNVVYTTVHISTNGFLRFDTPTSEYANAPIPSAASPNLAAYAFWDDLEIGAESEVLTRTLPDAFVVEWRNAQFRYARDDRVTFEAILHRNGDLEYQYGPGTGLATTPCAVPTCTPATGGSASIGIENGSGTIGIQYSFNDPAVYEGLGIVFSFAANPGLLKGTVDDGLNPIPDAKVTVNLGGGVTRTARTDGAGKYRLWLPPGVYPVTATKFGYSTVTDPAVAVATNSTTIKNFTLAALGTFTVSGTVTEACGLPLDQGCVSGKPLPGVHVETDNLDAPKTVTNALGQYTLTLPPGAYTVTVAPSNRCQERKMTAVALGPNAIANFQIKVRRDAFGMTCREEETTQYYLTDSIGLQGDDENVQVQLPFAFPFYGNDYQFVNISTNGFIAVNGASSEHNNVAIPSPTNPNRSIYPFWDDLVADSDSKIGTRSILSGTMIVAYAIEWKNLPFRQAPYARVTFEMVLYPSGDIVVKYRSGDGTLARGGGATIGTENDDGTVARQYALNEPALRPGLQVRFHPETHALTGLVAENGSGTPIADADVKAVGFHTFSTTTDSGGGYRMMVREGAYAVTASKFRYFPQTLPITITGPAVLNFLLNPAPSFKISGIVRDAADGTTVLPGVPVKAVHASGMTLTTTTDLNGYYEIFVPPGTYTVTASGRCKGGVSANVVVVAADVTQNFLLPTLRDTAAPASSSYICDDGLPIDYKAQLAPVLTSADSLTIENKEIPLPLPLGFRYYGKTERLGYISTNGFVHFALTPGSLLDSENPGDDPCGAPPCLPSAAAPNLAIYPFWDALVIDQFSKILVGPIVNPNNVLDGTIVEYRDVRFKGDAAGTDPNLRITFQLVLHTNGDIDFQYRTVPSPLPAQPPSVTSRPRIGLENEDGTKGLQYPFNVTSGSRITLHYLGT
jgi:subtilisin family serine protease